jgi:hypothetical protein
MFAPVLCMAAMDIVCFKHFPIARLMNFILNYLMVTNALGEKAY